MSIKKKSGLVDAQHNKFLFIFAPSCLMFSVRIDHTYAFGKPQKNPLADIHNTYALGVKVQTRPVKPLIIQRQSIARRESWPVEG